MPVFFLLLRRQLLILHLQLHSLVHILAFAEPENQIVTLFHTLCSHPGFLVKFCELIRPFFRIFRFFIFFQRLDLLLNRRVLRPQNLISQDMPVRIFRRHLNKFIVIINRLIDISRLQCKCTETACNLSASFCAVISNAEHIIAFLVVFNLFINITDLNKHGSIPHSAPVNHIRYICRFAICAVFHKLKHLFCF